MQSNPITDLVSVKPLRFVNVTAHDDVVVERCKSRFDTPYSPYSYVDADHDAGCFYSLCQKMLSFGQSRDTSRGCHHSQE